jgi:hypothetical protein
MAVGSRQENLIAAAAYIAEKGTLSKLFFSSVQTDQN